jgi:hypothetical protein
MAALRRVIAIVGKIVATIVAATLLWGAGWLWWWLKGRLTIGWDDPKAIGAFVVLIVAGLWGIWWLWWRLPQRYVARLALKIRDPKARADIEDSFRKTVGQALGGAAVLIGAGAAYLQFSAQQQATRDQLRSAHDLLISNQVSKGFEQLASDKMAMRLGGIYALEGVMNTSDQYHRPVLEALCAFVRESTVGSARQRPSTEVQAALAVIRRRSQPEYDIGLHPILDLSGANIPRVDLRVANLSLADLSDADLSGAGLGAANLSYADLRRANLGGANLFLTNLTGAKLGGANLSGALLDAADLTGAKLDGQAQLDKACGTNAKLPPGLTLKPCPK